MDTFPVRFPEAITIRNLAIIWAIWDWATAAPITRGVLRLCPGVFISPVVRTMLHTAHCAVIIPGIITTFGKRSAVPCGSIS